MTRSWRVLLGVGGLLLVAGVILPRLAGTPEEVGEGPHQGELAIFDPDVVGGWELLFHLTPEQLGGGGVRGLAITGDTLVLVQRHQWVGWVDGELRGPFGSATAGSPDWIAAGEGVAIVGDEVMILDARRTQISRWSLEGDRLGEVSLAEVGSGGVFPDQFRSEARLLYLTGRTLAVGGMGEWQLHRIDLSEGTGEIVFRRPIERVPGSALDAFIPLPLGDGRLEVGRAFGWDGVRLDGAGEVVGEWNRPGGPMWVVPDSTRRRLRLLLAQLPESERLAVELPETLPVLRGLEVFGENMRLALLFSGVDEHVHVELLTEDYEPLVRLWERPEEHPVFLAGGRVFRVREEMDMSVVEELAIRVGGRP